MKEFFLKAKNIERSSYIWNMVSSISLAVQSAVILVVMTRTNALADSGTFSIAYAISTLMLYIGQWGVRRYQASDINEEHQFGDYLGVRIITSGLMMIVSLVYVAYGILYGGYSATKAWVVILACLVQLVDSFSDLFYGRYQQKNRLDVAAKTTAFRVIAGMLGCMIALVITRNLLISVIVWLITVTITFYLSTYAVADEFCEVRARYSWKHIKKICVDCIPLFLANFLLLYVGNAPKYAIDAFMNEEAQARFNFIFMPVFVIGLMANFVFNPVLVKMAERWDAKNYRDFTSMVLRQIVVIAGITIICIIGAFLIGCPVLSVVFNTDLMSQRSELCILLMGGGCLALVNFFTVVLTVMRKQEHLTWGYVIVAILAKLGSAFFVKNYGIMGASLMYTTLMTALAAIFAVILIVHVRRETINRNKKEA